MREWTCIEKREARRPDEAPVYFLKYDDPDGYRPKYHKWWFTHTSPHTVKLNKYKYGSDSNADIEKGVEKLFREFPIKEVQNEDGETIAKLEINA
jgi:hypothetical protein